MFESTEQKCQKQLGHKGLNTAFFGELQETSRPENFYTKSKSFVRLSEGSNLLEEDKCYLTMQNIQLTETKKSSDKTIQIFDKNIEILINHCMLRLKIMKKMIESRLITLGKGSPKFQEIKKEIQELKIEENKMKKHLLRLNQEFKKDFMSFWRVPPPDKDTCEQQKTKHSYLQFRVKKQKSILRVWHALTTLWKYLKTVQRKTRKKMLISVVRKHQMVLAFNMIFFKLKSKSYLITNLQRLVRTAMNKFCFQSKTRTRRVMDTEQYNRNTRDLDYIIVLRKYLKIFRIFAQ
ncbi:hypothetical protein RFI_01488, partial [Reticulomyxa filosa]